MRVERGDGWELRLGDSLDEEGGLVSLDEVDHFISDPPYSREVYASYRTNGGRPDLRHRSRRTALDLSAGMIGNADDILEGTAAQAVRITKRWIIIFHDVERLHDWKEGVGERYMRCGAWVKSQPTPQISGDRPGQGFEACTIAHAPGRKRWNGGGRAALWRGPTESRKDRPDHPCPKPLWLMERLVADFTDAGELICDPFAGSATTGVACIRLGRRFIGWERDSAFFEMAAKRLRKTKAQGDLFTPTLAKPKQERLDV